MPVRLPILALMSFAMLSPAALLAASGQLVSEPAAARCGLTRPWFAQVQLDERRARLTDVLYFEGAIYAQTNAAMIHAMDAETGKTLWSQRVGRAGHPPLPLAAKGNLLAAVVGSRLFVLNRLTGELLYEKEIQDAPGAGPGLSTRRAYTPIVSGMMIAYRVEEGTNLPKKADDAATGGTTVADVTASKKVRLTKQDEPPLFCQSFGRALVAPLVTREFAGGEYVVWPTDRGCLNFGRIDQEAAGNLVLKYRLETRTPILAKPAYLPADPQVLGEAGIVFAATTDGFIYAIQEETGSTLWQYPTGETITESPAVIDDEVFVATELGGMYCFEGKTGKSRWWTESPQQFVAASKNRVYAVDRLGRLVILDRATGRKIDTLPINGVGLKVANTDTDRIYFASESGLIQCLRETTQAQPIQHGKERKDAWKAEASRVTEQEPEKPKSQKADKKADKSKADAKKRDDADNPFGASGDNPFGG